MNELLSICIPTYNRAEYLQDLLESIQTEIIKHPEIVNKFKIYISDNASTDRTNELCSEYSTIFRNMEYSRNGSNFGSCKNVLKSCTSGAGKYRWVIGDDELIAPNGLAHVIKILESERPGLLINNDGAYLSKLKLPAKYENFKDFAKAAIKAGNPHVLIAHSLITANVFLAKSFDARLAETKLQTRYAHMYGMISGLINESLTVYYTNYKTIIVRELRAPFSVDIVELPLVNLEQSWIDYINWIRSRLQLTELHSEEALKYHTILPNRLFKMGSSLLRSILPRSLYNMLKRSAEIYILKTKAPID
ncbi:MAG: glycosyltransferase [Legionellaceae bacterium]|nr:glycosyltransferase [Legionellaceae bacterium]